MGMWGGGGGNIGGFSHNLGGGGGHQGPGGGRMGRGADGWDDEELGKALDIEVIRFGPKLPRHRAVPGSRLSTASAHARRG